MDKVSKEIKELTKVIYTRKYMQLCKETGMKQFDTIEYKQSRVKGDYTHKAILIYAPFLYLEGKLSYIPRDDSFAIAVYSREADKWVWRGMYSDTNCIILKDVYDTENIDDLKIHYKVSLKNGPVNSLKSLKSSSLKKYEIYREVIIGEPQQN